MKKQGKYSESGWNGFQDKKHGCLT